MRFSKLRKLSRHVAGVQGERVSISRQNFFRGQVQCHARVSRQNQRRGAFCPCVYFSRHVTCSPHLEDTASVGGLQPVLTWYLTTLTVLSNSQSACCQSSGDRPARCPGAGPRRLIVR